MRHIKKTFYLFFFFISFLLFSQETNPEPVEPLELSEELSEELLEELLEELSEDLPEDLPEETTDPFQTSILNPAFVLERDIATSTLEELADWCRSLGLDTEGNRETLAARLWEYYQLEMRPLEATDAEIEESGVLIITIESARTTEYFSVESVKEDYVRLRGGVSVMLRDGGILHRIQAEHILYNRTRNILTASGGVVYFKEEEDTIESFRGEGITVNLDNWSTVFLRGISDRGISDGESSYRFAGEVISRNPEGSTVLRRAEITNAAEEESLWSINASRLWLLPGSDWAIVHAVVKVGEIPVLYLPAFYYPANEIIFRPVLGFRVREGTFVQTTTYILGRPKASESEEEGIISNIFGTSDEMETIREGVFLRSTGRRVRDQNEPRLSVLADAYTNLGYYLGSELFFPSSGTFGELLFSAGIAFSRDIAQDFGNYTPFFPDYDGTSNWHDSMFINFSVPFRYRFVTTGSAAGNGSIIQNAAISWNLPFYSDPYVDNDFMRRSEDSSLFSIMRNFGRIDFEISDNPIDQYIWELNSNLSISTTGLQPYINSLVINSATMAVIFNTRRTIYDPSDPRNQLMDHLSHPPDFRFFYPEKFTLFNASASISGMPINIGNRSLEIQTEETYIPGWGSPISPWDISETDIEYTEDDILRLRPPPLTRTVNVPALGGRNFSMDYRISPSAASELRYNSDRPNEAWNRQEDIDWNDVEYQLYTIRADGSVGFRLSERRDIYSHNLRFFGTGSWQDFSYVNESVPEARADTLMTQSRNMSFYTGSAEYGFTLRPFYQSEIWNTSNFRYTLRGLLVSGRYVEDEWEVNRGRWNNDDIAEHRLQANINANVMDQMQNLSISYDIPPEDSIVTGNATARIWISETMVRTRVRDILSDPFYEPVTIIETLRFNDQLSFRQHAVYDPELSQWTQFRSDLIWGGFMASFTAAWSRGYDLITRDEDPVNFGWYMMDTERLNPQDLSFSYRKNQALNEGNIMSFNINVDTGLKYDLQQYTSSSFHFTLGLGVRINRFLELTLRSHSENTVIFRYFQNAPFFNDKNIDVPGETNIFTDLRNSFNFFDTSKREASGFKLKSFSLDLVHYLGDWDATLGINLTPDLDRSTIPYRYRIISEISFLVQWKPIRELKVDMTYHSLDGISFE